MGDDYLTVIPTTRTGSPVKDAADRAAAVPAGMLPDDDARRGLAARWHDSVEVVDCGSRLESIGCPHCPCCGIRLRPASSSPASTHRTRHVVGNLRGITLPGALTRPQGQIASRRVPGLRGRRVTGGLSTANTAGMSP
ncbi:hypothetical protein [Streptomyces venezuelae]|uniref:hypothetical protein n=1 Tax=Streptomyces venezuelae TaxID=54571 RepID=UPI00331EAAF3